MSQPIDKTTSMGVTKYQDVNIDHEDLSKSLLGKDQVQGENPLKPPRQEMKSIMLAATAGVCFALGNYVLGIHADLGVLAREVSENGSLVFVIIFLLFSIVKSKYQGKTYWSWESCNFRDQETDGIHWIKVFGTVVYTLINVIQGFLVVFTFQFATYANMNQGILTSLFSFSAIFSALLAYFIFQDRLRIWHGIGIVFMILCIVGLGIGSEEESELEGLDESGHSLFFYSLISILFGILCPVCFSVGGLVVRYFSDNYNYCPIDLTISCYFWSNVILIICMIFTFEYGSHPFILSEYLQIAASGLLTAIGVVFLNMAVTCGLAGPVFALANIQVIIQTILQVLINGKVPNLIEIIAAALGVIGACTIALGPDIKNLIQNLSERSKTQ
ncbi:unnamed protein product [Moneuplotes crassus]|uniref:EamA domain-containing protein n=1 Tax=Euplotes crassus TaxID=5936 RepID=A0AAD1UDW3_EUPCR|nr:unnamed protein product [Moneuplotes crassus]